MSTKATREVLAWARDMDFDRETLDAALAEVEAIEKAAKDFARVREVSEETMILLERIAEEAP